MEVEIKKPKDSKITLVITLSPVEFEKYEQEAVGLFRNELKLKGFRKGKVPMEVVKREVGTEILLTRSAERAIQKSYQKIILEKGFEPISQPQVEILKLAPGNDFQFKAIFTVLPELELPDYKKIAKAVSKQEIIISQKEIEDTLEWLKKARPELKEIQVPAQKEHFVEIEFSSPEIEGGKKHEDGFILGKGRVIPGFGEQLAGMKANTEKDFLLTLPEDFWMKNLSGKKARFHIKMKKVCEVKERKIDDAFAQAIGSFKDLDELKQNIKQGLEAEKNMAENKRREEEALKKIVEKTQIKVPTLLVEREKKRRLDELKKQALQKMDMSFEQYLKKIGKSEEELEMTFEKEAREGAKRFLVLRKLSKKEKIEVSNDEVEKAVEQALSRYPDSQKAREAIDAVELKRYTEASIRSEKTLKKLLSFN